MKGSDEIITTIEKEMEGIVSDPLVRNQILIEMVAEINSKTANVILTTPKEEIDERIKEETLGIFEELKQIIESSIRSMEND